MDFAPSISIASRAFWFDSIRAFVRQAYFSRLNRDLVLENDVIFGAVNANRRHYQLAAAALAKADRDWLHRLISRRVPLVDWRAALERQPDDIKVVIDFCSEIQLEG